MDVSDMAEWEELICNSKASHTSAHGVSLRGHCLVHGIGVTGSQASSNERQSLC